MVQAATHTQHPLLEACLQGDRSAQNQLYEAHKVLLFGVCMRYTQNREEAEDLLQEGFFKIFRDLHQFEGRSSLSTWMHRVMVNVALSYLRKQRRNIVTAISPDEGRVNVETEPEVWQELGANAIIELIQQLPTGYRTIFNLYAIEGFSHKEIAARLSISPATSRSQYLRARRCLQLMIQKHLML